MTANDSRSVSNLFSAGIIAGPFFALASLVHGALRGGFSLVRHPASMLSLGDLGWIQIANFVLTGILFILCGIALRRGLTEGIGRTWPARLIILFGIALIIGGVFTADPGLGFPPGTPEGVPKEMSWHGSIHAFAPILGFMSHTIALLILARRFGAQGQKGWMISTVAAALGMFVLASVPNFTADWEKGVFNFLPLWAGTIIGFGWTSFVIWKLRSEVILKQ